MILTLDFKTNLYYNATSRFDWWFNTDLDDIYVGF